MADLSPRMALCLSGGGFRAALFHLGSLRRLHEVGALRKVTTICSVSGGSILSGFVATRMIELGLNALAFDDFERDLAEPFRSRVAGHDLRTWPMLLHLPWNWLVPGPRAAHLESKLRRCLAGPLLQQGTTRALVRDTLGHLPASPEFIFCATNLVFGVNWEFRRDGARDYMAGKVSRAAGWPIARAVAASACFPPLFGPMPLGLSSADFVGGKYHGADRDELLRRVALSDGGVYDNLGLEPVWKSHSTVLVSDCGAPFTSARPGHYLRRLLRYTAVVANQAAALRKRAYFADISPKNYLQPGAGAAAVGGDADSEARPGVIPTPDTGGTVKMAHVPPRYRGGYWGIAGTVDRYKHPNDPLGGYSHKLVDEVIERVRTDLDRFSQAEMKVLENHGYLLTAAVLARRRPELSHNAPPASAPHPEWMDESLVRGALRRSHRRLVASRLLGFDCW